VGGINRPRPASILRHRPHPVYQTDLKYCNSLLFSFPSCIDIHYFGLFLPSLSPRPLSSYLFALSSGFITFFIRYFLLHFSFPLPTIDVHEGACAHADTDLLSPPHCSRCITRDFPPRVERRVCCGGERGSVWSVGLNVCCP